MIHMHNLSIKQSLATNSPLFSVEFFPPKSNAAACQLLETALKIQTYKPDFVSITYGAGGSTRSRTLSYARKLQEDYGYRVMPHLTCMGHSRDELKQIIHEFKEAGIQQIMALRGDPPKTQANFTPHPDGLSYANQLVELIREVYPECEIGVAGYPEKHPEAPSLERDLVNLKRKVDAGATFITTQLFFDNSAYYKFVEKCHRHNITIPILPGIMSATSYKQIVRFCDMCGASIPEALNRQLLAVGDDRDAAEAIGMQWCYEQTRELIENGAPGIHLYILNRADIATALMDQLKSDGLY
jgi:methylenetetrahydrofolate reductase (NADPH)